MMLTGATLVTFPGTGRSFNMTDKFILTIGGRSVSVHVYFSVGLLGCSPTSSRSSNLKDQRRGCDAFYKLVLCSYSPDIVKT